VGVGGALPASVKEVLRYREAAYDGWHRLQETGVLTTNQLVHIVQALKGNDAGVRTTGVVIGNRTSQEIIYTPPEGEAVIRDKLAGLERFMNVEEAEDAPDSELSASLFDTAEQTAAHVDPLVRMALVHYQFEAIHPFYDGNGRTGRILNVLYLIHQGLLDSPILYLSAYILGHRTEYYRLLRSVTEDGAWEAWIVYMLEAVRATALATLDLIRAINSLMERMAETAREGMKNGYSRDLIRLLFQQPYCKIQFVIDEGLGSRMTASRYLADLERLGLVRTQQVHRDKYFVNHGLLDLLAAFRP
jgi:Fic family protein